MDVAFYFKYKEKSWSNINSGIAVDLQFVFVPTGFRETRLLVYQGKTVNVRSVP